MLDSFFIGNQRKVGLVFNGRKDFHGQFFRHFKEGAFLMCLEKAVAVVIECIEAGRVFAVDETVLKMGVLFQGNHSFQKSREGRNQRPSLVVG